jgi:hypothetical protein
MWLEKDSFYRDSVSRASVPVSDLALVWDQDMVDLFMSRGLPSSRIKSIGAIKFTHAREFVPSKPREELMSTVGLVEGTPIVLLVLQTLDNTVNPAKARFDQLEWLRTIAGVCAVAGFQLLIRLPPSEAIMISPDDVNAISGSPVLDEPPFALSPLEAIWLSAAVISVSSTMLLEAQAMGRAVTRLLAESWSADRIAQLLPEEIHTVDDLKNFLHAVRDRGGPDLSNYPVEIQSSVSRLALDREGLFAALASLEANNPASVIGRFARGGLLDVIGIPSSTTVLRKQQVHLQRLLNARTLVSTAGLPKTSGRCSSIELFFEWGAKESRHKATQRCFAASLDIPVLFIEDGLYRSVGLGVEGAPALSLTWDEGGHYYMTGGGHETGLKKSLRTQARTSEEKSRAEEIVRLVCDLQLSKYNKFIDNSVYTRSTRPKILLVDQRFGDASIAGSGGSQESFSQMVQAVTELPPNYEVIIKTHPDASVDGYNTSLTRESVQSLVRQGRTVYWLDANVNPASLLSIVNQVWVVSSGLGFEAGIRGIPVRVFAKPFYYGFGLTQGEDFCYDINGEALDWRDLVFEILVRRSRYVDPVSNLLVSPEAFLVALHEAAKRESASRSNVYLDNFVLSPHS